MFCPNCGTKLPDDAVFCANCGTKLRTEEETKELVAKETEAPAAANAEEAASVSEKASEKIQAASAAVGAAVSNIDTEKIAQTATNVKNSALEYAKKAKEATNAAIGGTRAASAPSESYTDEQYEAQFADLGFEPFKRDSNGQPKEYRNLLTFGLILFIFSIVYQPYSIYRLTKVTNKDPNRTKRGALAQLLLCFVPFYGIHWHRATAQRIADLYRIRYKRESDITSVCTILSIFSIVAWFPGLGTLSIFLMQREINKVVGGRTGFSENSTGYGHCDSCGHEGFPDDVEHCPECGAAYSKPIYRKYWFQLIAGLIGFILVWIIMLSLIF